MKLKVKEVAEKLGMSIGFVYKLINDGELKASKYSPRSLRIEEDDLNEWIKRTNNV